MSESDIEFGTLQMTISVKAGELLDRTPRLDILQNNLKEVVPLIPDGVYKWTLIMRADNAERSDIE